MKKIKKATIFLIPFLEIIYLPLLMTSGLVMWVYRRLGSQRLRLSTKILKKIGVFPIRNHYYEPLFDDKDLSHKLSQRRELPGINFREAEQIKFLEKLNYQTEFSEFVEVDSVSESLVFINNDGKAVYYHYDTEELFYKKQIPVATY